MIYLAVQLPLLGAALSVFAYVTALSFLSGKTGSFFARLAADADTALRKKALAKAAAAMFLVSGSALLVYYYYFIEHDLSIYNTAYHSSADYNILIRLTSVMWAHPSGVLLFASFLTAAAAALLYLKHKDSPLLLLPSASVFGLFQMILAFHPEAQPFRSFPVPVILGAGISPPELHWSRSFYFPLVFFSFVMLLYHYSHSMNRFLSSGSLSAERDLRILKTAWVTASLSMVSVLFYNFQALEGSSLWNWNRDEMLLLAYLFSLGALLLRPSGRFAFISESVALHTGLFFLWAHLSAETGKSASVGPGEIIGIFTLLHSAGMLIFVYKNFKIISPDPDSGGRPVTVRLLAYLFTGMSALLSVSALYLLIPADCAFYGPELLCHRPSPDSAVLTVIFGPLLASLLAVTAGLLVISSRDSAPVFILSAAGGAVLAFMIWFFLYDPDPGTAALLILILSASSASVILADAMLRIFRSDRKNADQIFFPVLTAGASVLAISFTAASLAPAVTEEFHYNLMMQYPETDQVHYYSGDKIYSGKAEIQATDLFLTASFAENAYRQNRAKLRIIREAHFLRRRPGDMRFLKSAKDGQSPYSLAHETEPDTLKNLLHTYLGHHPYGRITAVSVSYPEISPVSGEVVSAGERTGTLRKRYTAAGRHSLFIRDITAEIVSLKNPSGPLTAELDFIYEYFFYDTGLSPEAYYSFFPESLIAEIRFRSMPLLSLVWISAVFLIFLNLFYLLNELQNSGSGIRRFITPEESE